MIDVMEIDIDRPEKVVYVVGLGPGEPFYMTQQAANTLESVDAICGYKVYLDLIRDEFPCEEYYSTGMTQELDRCRWALEKARTGKRVALEPMNPNERRILHSALQNDPEVTTHSEGEEPYRRVIITLK